MFFHDDILKVDSSVLIFRSMYYVV
jgi:hypothetical protein